MDGSTKSLKTSREEQLKGDIKIYQMDAMTLQGNPLNDPSRRTVLVYLPPGYGEDVSLRYPAVYLLHGFAGSALQWLNTAPFTDNVPQRLDGLIAGGAAPPVIAVFADGWTSLGGSQWMNSEGIGCYRDYVAEDLVQWTDSTFRTVPRAGARALIGKSSGGYGALAITRFHPDVFQHIGVHSADSAFEYSMLHELPRAAGHLLRAGSVEAWYTDFIERASTTNMRSEDFPVINMLCMAAAYSPKLGQPFNAQLPIELPSGRLQMEVWDRWLMNDPVRFVPQCLQAYRQLRSIFIDCGTRDEFNLRWGARLISEAFQKGGIAHLHEEFEGGHRGVNYRFERSFSWLLPRLDRA